MRENNPKAQRFELTETVVRGFRHTLRGLRRQAGVSGTVVAVVALGVALSGATATVLDTVERGRLPGEDPEQLLVLSGTYEGAPYWSLGVPELRELEEGTSQVGEIGIFSAGHAVTWTGTGPARRLEAGYASAAVFRVLGVRPMLGRLFASEEDHGEGGAPVALVTDGFWRSELGGDPAVLGRTLRLGAQSFTVVGVLPPDFRLAESDVWLPLSMGASAFGPGFEQNRRARYHFGVARLPDGVPAARIQEALSGVMQRLEAEHPEAQRDRGVRAFPLREWFYGGLREPARLLSLAGFLVFLLCGVNAGALLLLRAGKRSREMAVRAALGGSRIRRAGSHLADALILCGLGAVLGLVLARFGLRWAEPRIGLPDFAPLETDPQVVGLLLGLCLVLGTVAGLAPVWWSRTDGLAAVLRSGGARAGSGRAERRRTDLVVVFEIGLALTLLVAAGLTTRSFVGLASTELGFATEDLLTSRLDLDGIASDAESEVRRSIRIETAARIVEKLEAQPDVVSAVVWGPGALGTAQHHTLVVPPGHDPAREDHRFFSQRLVLDTGGFEALGIPLLRGRGFGPEDRLGSDPVVVIDEELAGAFWPDEDPVGTTLRVPGPEGFVAARVVGVAAAVRHRGRRSDDGADGVHGDVYFPWAQVGGDRPVLAVRLRPGSATGAAEQSIRSVVAEVAPDVPVSEFTTLVESLDRRAATPRFAASLTGIFALGGALLALVGTYGLLAFVIRGRRRELAMRAALGADRGAIRRLLVRRAAPSILGGLCLGSVGGSWLASSLDDLLFGIGPADPATWITVVALLAVSAFAACWLPARSASRVAPALVLREE